MRNLPSYEQFAGLDEGFGSGAKQEYRDFVSGSPIEAQIGKKSLHVRVTGKVNAKDIKKGMRLGCAYNSTNAGVDFVEILGVTSADDKYGDSGKPAFDSVRAAMAHYKVTSLAGLEALEKEHGDSPRLLCKDLSDEAEQGAWYYLYKGRYARGSGAEVLTFFEFEEVTNESERVDEGMKDTSVNVLMQNVGAAYVKAQSVESDLREKGETEALKEVTAARELLSKAAGHIGKAQDALKMK